MHYTIIIMPINTFSVNYSLIVTYGTEICKTFDNLINERHTVRAESVQNILYDNM